MLDGYVTAIVAGPVSFDPMLAYLAANLAILGYIDQARVRMNEALSEARRLGHAHTLAGVLNVACGMEAKVQRHSEELLALSTEHGFPFYLGYATAFRGASLIARGQAQEGLALITRGLAAVRATGAILTTPGMLVQLAGAYANLGRLAEGLNCLAEAAIWLTLLQCLQPAIACKQCQPNIDFATKPLACHAGAVTKPRPVFDANVRPGAAQGSPSSDPRVKTASILVDSNVRPRGPQCRADEMNACRTNRTIVPVFVPGKTDFGVGFTKSAGR